jgi:hypothetical protein
MRNRTVGRPPSRTLTASGRHPSSARPSSAPCTTRGSVRPRPLVPVHVPGRERAGQPPVRELGLPAARLPPAPRRSRWRRGAAHAPAGTHTSPPPAPPRRAKPARSARRRRRRSDARSTRATASATDTSSRASPTPDAPPRPAASARGLLATRRSTLGPPHRSARKGSSSGVSSSAPSAAGFRVVRRWKTSFTRARASAFGQRSMFCHCPPPARRRRATRPAGSAAAARHPRARQRPPAGSARAGPVGSPQHGEAGGPDVQGPPPDPIVRVCPRAVPGLAVKGPVHRVQEATQLVPLPAGSDLAPEAPAARARGAVRLR